MRLTRTIGAAVVAATVTACTLAPHYERPAAPVAATWTGGTPPSTNTTAAPDMGWRQFFPDPGMQRLIELALANNRDLRVAALNVQATQAQYRVQRATLFPSVALTGLEQVEKYPSGVSATQGAAAGVSTGGQTIRFYEAGVGFTSYEIDFFGKIGRAHV